MSSVVNDSKRLKTECYSIAVVYNCPRKEYEKVLAEVNLGTIVDELQLGVRLKAGFSPTDTSPSTCSLWVVMAASSGTLKLFEPQLCNRRRNAASVQHGLRQGSIILVTRHAPKNAFSPRPTVRIGSLDDLSRLKDIGNEVLYGFTLAANILATEVKNHQEQRYLVAPFHSRQASQGKGNGQSRGKCKGKFERVDRSRAPGKKNYEREHNCSSETLRNIQRIRMRIRFLPEVASLGLNPCQLGFSDAIQFQNVADDCCIGGRNKKLWQMLQKMCNVGLLSWKIRDHHDSHTPVFQRSQVISHFLHTLKEMAMQRVLSGAVIMHGLGNIPESEDKVQQKRSASASTTLLIAKAVGAKPSSIAKHVCILMPLKVLPDFQFYAGAAVSESCFDAVKAIFRADVIAQCEFQIIRGWNGIGKKAIRLMGKSHLQNQPLHYFVLEYVGVEYNAISLLQKCRENPSEALFQYVSTHCERHSKPLITAKECFAFHDITCKEVEACLVKQKIQLSYDQALAVQEISLRRRHVVALRGPPGASKTTLSVGIFLHLVRGLAPHQKLFWLVKTRKMRDKALNEFRSYLDNPCLVIGLGRSDNDSSEGSETQEFDPVISKFLEQSVALIVKELTFLLNLLKLVDVTTDWKSRAGEEWKQNSERMAKFNFQLYLAKGEALARVFDEAKLLCMTVDGFIQSASGESMLSRYIKPYEIVACGVDEAHQLEHSVLSAICARCLNVFLVWDAGQRIKYTRQNSELGQSAILAEEAVFAWEKAVHGGSSYAIWETMCEDDIVSIKWTWRFGPAPALYLR